MKWSITILAATAAITAAFGGATVLAACSDDGAPMLGTCMAMDDTAHGQPRAVEPRAGTDDEVTCPVDGMRFRPAANTPSGEYRGKVYYFCSAAERGAFLKEPERYVGASAGGHAH